MNNRQTYFALCCFKSNNNYAFGCAQYFAQKLFALLQQYVFVTAVLEYLCKDELRVMTKAVHMVIIHTVGFNVTNLVLCKFSGAPTASKILFKLLNHPFMMVLNYV